LDLGREWIDAKKSDGTDDTYIILIDGLEVPYQETASDKSRILTIQFQEGDSDIEIIGTKVIPEFGPIAVIILMSAIASAIIISKRTSLQFS
jgi:predicted secreted protein with PEFG-CTERM motif